MARTEVHNLRRDIEDVAPHVTIEDRTYTDCDGLQWQLHLCTDAVIPPRSNIDEVTEFWENLDFGTTEPTTDQVVEVAERLEAKLQEARREVRAAMTAKAEAALREAVRVWTSSRNRKDTPDRWLGEGDHELLNYVDWRYVKAGDATRPTLVVLEAKPTIEGFEDKPHMPVGIVQDVPWGGDRIEVSSVCLGLLRINRPMSAAEFKGTRRTTGLSQKEFGEAMNPADPVPERAVTRWEQGDRAVSGQAGDLAADVVTALNRLTTSLVAEREKWFYPLSIKTYSDNHRDRFEAVTPAMHRIAAHRAAAILRAQGQDVSVELID